MADYFSGAIELPALREEVASIVGKNGLRTGREMFLDLDVYIEVSPAHLVGLCDAVIGDELSADELQAISFFLIASEHFAWDTETTVGSLVADVLFEWSAPQINYALTVDTLIAYREGLQNGCHPFR